MGLESGYGQILMPVECHFMNARIDDRPRNSMHVGGCSKCGTILETVTLVPNLTLIFSCNGAIFGSGRLSVFPNRMALARDNCGSDCQR